MAQLIRLTGIVSEGRHGAREGERDRPQPFVIDLELSVETNEDHLETTADYRLVVDTVREVVAQESFALLETLAERLAVVGLWFPGVRWCRVVVHKPAAAQRLGVADIGVEAEAGEDSGSATLEP